MSVEPIRKHLSITVAVPTAGTVPIDFAYSLVALVSHIMSKGVASRRECSVGLRFDVVQSSSIHGNREQLARRSVDRGDTHLLFIDDDMEFQPEALEFMLGRRAPVVVTNYLLKRSEPEFMAVGLDGYRVPTLPDSMGTYPIGFAGFGFSLFEAEVFKRIPQPWFTTEWDGTKHTTEDYPFFTKVRAAGYDVLLDHDASKLLGHCGRKVWRWAEWAPTAVSNQQGDRHAEQEAAG